jgi:3-methyl-2-oxobutanoate hydroxymethyltransferase
MTQLSAAQNKPSDGSKALYGGKGTRRITVRDIALAKERGEKWPMLTAYDAMTASVFDEAGIPVLLVGDSAGNCHLGYETTVPVTLDEMTMLSAAVVRGTQRALIVGDLPFGSYQVSDEDAVRTAIRFVKEGRADIVKLEGAGPMVSRVRRIVEAGIPVMGHIGLTPQSVHALGGYRVQGRDDATAERLKQDAAALEQAGAFAVVLELVPAPLASQISKALTIPTIGIGAGPACDGQVLVLHDMLGLNDRFSAKFVKKYAALAEDVREAVRLFSAEVREGRYPGPEHSFGK